MTGQPLTRASWHVCRAALAASCLAALLAGTAVGFPPIESVYGDGQPAATNSPATDAPAATADATIDNAVTNEQPSFFVRASLNREVRDYREGDTLAIRVCCEVDAYLYVLYQQADGKVYQIFPNEGQKDNRVAAKQEVTIPGTNDLFRWEIGPPFGKEQVKVIACRQQLKGLSGADLRRQRFNPVSKSLFKTTVGELAGVSHRDWAETDLELRTHGAAEAPIDEGARRVGVFFGVAQHQFNAEHMAGLQLLIPEKDRVGDGHLDLLYCDNDATDLAATLRDVGRLSDAVVATNADATRANMERLITRWLPSVTKPGDTVIISFASHGGQIADDNNDERDGKDEVLIPHDSVDLLTLAQLIELKKSGQLAAELEPRVAELVEVAVAAGDNPSQQNDALVRHTGISDDLFAHWLQRLAGRHVIVILDTCHSAGFADQEKGSGNATVKSPTPKPLKFDFLEGELVRLKDLGQPEQAMLAACMAAETAAPFSDGTKNGVLTGYVLKCLRETPGPVRLDDAYDYCREAFPSYFEAFNRWRSQNGLQPVTGQNCFLINHCTGPMYLKP